MSMMTTEQKLDKTIATIFKPSYTGKRKLTYSEFLSNKMLMIRLIRAGVPYSLFVLIKEITPFTENDWAVQASTTIGFVGVFGTGKAGTDPTKPTTGFSLNGVKCR